MINSKVEETFFWSGECNFYLNPKRILDIYSGYQILLNHSLFNSRQFILGLNITPYCSFNISPKLYSSIRGIDDLYHSVTPVEN